MGSLYFASFGYASRLSPVQRGFACAAAYTLTPVLPLTGGAALLRHPVAWLLPAQVPRSTDNRSEDHVARFGRLVSPGSPGTRSHGYGNINPLSIDYACRPRLRSRLTLGGLAWPRNPWSFGGRVSHSAFATHACILTRAASTPGFHRRFAGCTTLPYPSARLRTARRTARIEYANDTASAVCLSPATLSAQDHLTSELLRTL
jgi:hypothetical protein